MIEEEQAIQNSLQQRESHEEAMMGGNPEEMAYKYAGQLAELGEEKRQVVMQKMQQEMPNMAGLIMEKFQEIQQAGGQQQTENQQQPQQGPVDMRPQPEKQPPRRDTPSI